MDRKHASIYFSYPNGPNLTLLIPYEKEMFFFNELSNGNVEFLEENLRDEPFYISAEAGFHVLSRDAVRNAKYHFYGTATLAARYCIQKGMGHHHALGLIRYYNQKADLLDTEDAIAALHAEMCMQMCQEMKEILGHKTYSKTVRQCMDYIYAHLGERISVAEVSEHVKVCECHLSKQFKSELGVSLSEYILQQKIEHAKNLLQYSRLSIVEIGELFSFSSQSHFTRIFKKETGVTPHKYREMTFQGKWDATNHEPSKPDGEETDGSCKNEEAQHETKEPLHQRGGGGNERCLKND